jgi:hypothetical protein
MFTVLFRASIDCPNAELDSFSTSEKNGEGVGSRRFAFDCAVLVCSVTMLDTFGFTTSKSEAL